MEHHYGTMFFSLIVIFLLFSLTLIDTDTNSNLITGKVVENIKNELINCEEINVSYELNQNMNEKAQVCFDENNQIKNITILKSEEENTQIINPTNPNQVKRTRKV